MGCDFSKPKDGMMPGTEPVEITPGLMWTQQGANGHTYNIYNKGCGCRQYQDMTATMEASQKMGAMILQNNPQLVQNAAMMMQNNPQLVQNAQNMMSQMLAQNPNNSGGVGLNNAGLVTQMQTGGFQNPQNLNAVYGSMDYGTGFNVKPI